MRRIWAIMWKEWLHIIRDPRTIIMILVIPPMMVVLFGYALTYDVKSIPLAVSDSDQSAASRALIKDFSSSDYFRLTDSINGEAAIEAGFRAGDYKAALIVPRGFASDLAAQRTAPIEVAIDGSNTIIAGAAQRYTLVVSQQFAAAYALKNAPPALAAKLTKPAIRLLPRILYNPDLSSINFIVPGLIALILMMIPAIITSVAIVREKETGTIEQLIVSPIKSYELMLGKITPYMVISALNAVMIIAAGVLWFGIPFRGSVPLLALMIVLYMMTTVGIGLLISTLTETMLTAQMVAFLGTMLPAFMLSGFVFPIESMPWFLQAVSYIVPGRYFLVVLRSIFLKGTGLASFWQQAVALLIFGVVLLTVSTLRFRKRVL